MSEDAVRGHYRDTLARRMQGAPEAVQRVLREKLASLPAHVPDHTPAGPAEPPRRRAVPVLKKTTPLAELQQHIAMVTGQPAGERAELRSAQAFRDTWSRLCAEDDVTRAVQRGPENAGPLNSHMLVLRTLALLRELSPDYLRRFMAHADTLLWLDEAGARLKPAPARARAARQKK